jgi:hypothetical protein
MPPTTVYTSRIAVNPSMPVVVEMPNTVFAISPAATICAWM